jgi:DNA end-binding protein Ku
MPRPSWSGLLELSLVSCPVYLSPATSEAERIRLHMINPSTGNRIAMVTVDSETREPVERSETVKGYQVEKGQYVILSDDEVKDLNVESSRSCRALLTAATLIRCLSVIHISSIRKSTAKRRIAS